MKLNLTKIQPKPKKCGEDFRQTNLKSAAIKNGINDLILDQTLSIGHKPREHHILILDASDLNTALRFYNEGVTKIVIPNPFECITINRYIRDHPEITDVLFVPSQTVGEYIAGLKSGPRFTSVFLDYFGCFTGNVAAGISPQEDIKMLLQKNLMRSPSILAFTTALRCGKLTDQIGRFLREISILGPNYCFVKLFASKYKGKSGRENMGIVILRLDERKPNEKCKRLTDSYSKYENFKKFLNLHDDET